MEVINSIFEFQNIEYKKQYISIIMLKQSM